MSVGLRAQSGPVFAQEPLDYLFVLARLERICYNKSGVQVKQRVHETCYLHDCGDAVD